MTPPEAICAEPSTSGLAPAHADHQSPQTSTRRIPAIDGLRALAISLVLAGHAVEGASAGHPGIIWAPFLNSSLGVRLFFVLSGFLITRLLLAEQALTGSLSLRDFYIRRSIRIFPAFYLFLGVVGILAVTGWMEVSWQQFVSAATYTWNYRPLVFGDGPADGSWFLGHLWTLSLEEQFYLAWPGLIVLGGWKRARWICVAIPLLMPAIRIASYFLFPEHRGYLGIMFHTAIDSIMVGCAFALLEDRIPARWLTHRGVFWGCLLFVFLVSPMIAETVKPYRITVGFGLDAFCAGVLTLHATRKNTWSRILSKGALPLIGTWSYSIYLWQQLFLGSKGVERSGSMLASFAALTACALISFYLVERPVLRLKSRFARVQVIS